MPLTFLHIIPTNFRASCEREGDLIVKSDAKAMQ